MKILVTGAAGFIGSYITRELIRRGDDVIGIDNFNDYYPKECKEFNLDLTYLEAGEKAKKFNKTEVEPIFKKLHEYRGLTAVEKPGKYVFVEGDIVDKELVPEIFKKNKPEAVIHLAAMAGVPYSLKKPLLYSEVNVTGTVNLLEQARQHNLKKFVFGSSSSVYGDRNSVPFREDDDVSQPISTYAATKRMGELIGYTYHYLYKIPIINARIFGPIYGPLQRFYGMAAQRFIKQVYQGKPITIYGHGTMGRDSTYIDDEVSGLIKCLDADIEFDTFNIGTGNPVTVNDLADYVIKYFGKGSIVNIDKPPTEVPITFADISKAKKHLGYEPKMTFEEGIKRQVEVFKMMPDWYKNMEEKL